MRTSIVIEIRLVVAWCGFMGGADYKGAAGGNFLEWWNYSVS